MVKNTTDEQTLELLKKINESILDKKGESLINMNLQNIENAITKYFVVCTANSSMQASTICDYIEYKTKCDLKERPWKKEGIENCEWILLDYVDVVVHIFQPKPREFYKLEQLWADAEITAVGNE